MRFPTICLLLVATTLLAAGCGSGDSGTPATDQGAAPPGKFESPKKKTAN